MAASTNPIFTVTPVAAAAVTSAANTARDGSGSLVTLYTVGANGALIDSITFASSQASVATSSSMVATVFYSTDGGSTKRFKASIAIGTITPSATVIGAIQTIDFQNGFNAPSGVATGFRGGWALPASAIVYVIQSVFAGAQDQFHVSLAGGEY